MSKTIEPNRSGLIHQIQVRKNMDAKMASKGQTNLEMLICVTADIQTSKERQRPYDVETPIQFCLKTHCERCPVRQSRLI